MKKSKNGLVIIYVLVMVTLWVIIASVLLSNSDIIRNNYEVNKTLQTLNLQMLEQRKINISNYKKYLSDSIWWDDCIVSSWADNDWNHRKEIIWYLRWESYIKNVFLANSAINTFIEWNTNNYDNSNKLISNILSWSLYIQIDGWNSYIKLVKMDKTKYNSNNEFSSLWEWSRLITWTWYLQNNWTLNPTKTYNFDFKDYDYAIFMSGWTINTPIKYTITLEDISWSWVYINPIQDNECNESKLKFMWYSLDYSNEWKISGNILNVWYNSSINIINYWCILWGSSIWDCKF